MILDVALRVRRARIDGARIDASAIQTSHIRRTLRITLAYYANLFVHWHASNGGVTGVVRQAFADHCSHR